MSDGKYQYSLVENLSFLRFGGTEGERRAGDILMSEIERAGGAGRYMDFSIPAYELKSYSAEITEPFKRRLDVLPYGLSGQLPEGGADFKFLYADRCTGDDLADIDDLTGFAVLINQLTYDAYKLLCEKHAGAFLTISGKYYDTPDTADILPRSLRPDFLALGKIPGFMIRASDATEIVRLKAETIHLELRQWEGEHTSRNLLATIRGTSGRSGSIVLTAHYDSVLVGTGSWDNATGAAALMALYRRFINNPPARTLRFIWCGSEEQGLLGSKAYIKDNPEDVDDIVFCFNFDMNGTVLGPNRLTVTGSEALLNMTDQISRELGFPADISLRVHSSDSAPFADAGIPAVGISRGTTTAEIHTRHDLIYPLCPEQMGALEEFASSYIGRIANSIVMPIDRGMPENMKSELDKYFLRDKTGNKT